jgi:hypothetical protein
MRMKNQSNSHQSQSRICDEEDNSIFCYIMFESFVTIDDHVELCNQTSNNEVHKMVQSHPPEGSLVLCSIRSSLCASGL